MQNPDAAEATDAALQELLASVVEHLDDPAKQVIITDFLPTMRPLAEWSAPEIDALTDTCAYVISLARMSREVDILNDGAS